MPAPASTIDHGIAPCPSCDAQLIAPLTAAGRTARCTHCGTRFTLPGNDELFDAAVALMLTDHEDPDADDFDDVAPMIQNETMIRDELAPDPAWIG